MENKPIILRKKDGENIMDIVWCPFWGEQPNLKKAKAEGRLLETKNSYTILYEEKQRDRSNNKKH